MKKNSLIISVSFFIAIFCTSCLDEISIDTPAVPDGVLIFQGKLVKGAPSKIVVSITQLFEFTGFNQPQNNNNALVEIRDEDGNSLVIPSILGETYELEIPENAPGFSVEVGKSYQLFVQLDDGRKYESILEPIHETPNASVLETNFFRKVVEDFEGNFFERDFLEYRISTPLSAMGEPKKARLKWEYEGVYQLVDSPTDGNLAKTCYILDKANFDKVVVFDGNEVAVNALDIFPVYEVRPNFKYADGYYLTIYQEALSVGAYEYFSSLSDVIERNGNIFEEPAGKIKSNFKNIEDSEEEIFGYFYAVSQDTIRVLTDPADVNFPNRLCPQPPGPGMSAPNECDNCLLFGGAGLIAPDYWEM